jgi:hypothetical protein
MESQSNKNQKKYVNSKFDDQQSLTTRLNQVKLTQQPDTKQKKKLEQSNSYI